MYRAVLLGALAATASAFQAPAAFRAPTSRASPLRFPVFTAQICPFIPEFDQ
jgi:hypothetical protein